MSEMVERVALAISGGDDPANILSIHRTRAVAAIKAMRAVPDLCYDQYDSDKTWRRLDSRQVWNLWLDAALK